MKLRSTKSIVGFSKLTKRGKLKWMVENFFRDPELVMKELMSYWLHDEEKQRIIDQFSENTVSNFHLPYGVAPNLVLNGETYCVPMVIEESSVVAAASNATKFWASRGGFKAEVIQTHKTGQVHFTWTGSKEILLEQLPLIERKMRESAAKLLKNMEARGGGVRKLELIDLTDQEDHFYQLLVTFETCNSMGANFINSVLEDFARTLRQFAISSPEMSEAGALEIIMAILSNYTPACRVRAWVDCPIAELGSIEGLSAEAFAKKFEQALRIAEIDPYRAATHNKGILNGIDAVVIATGNDFRAVEANAHVYAAKSGQYRSLSHCLVVDGHFKCWLEIPLSMGTIGGLTALHPMAKRSLELLGYPDAKELMMITAAMGLAQNFAAVRSLITTGIQQGHMRMHLINVLGQLEASEREAKEAIQYFSNKVVSHSAVQDFLRLLRQQKPIVRN